MNAYISFLFAVNCVGFNILFDKYSSYASVTSIGKDVRYHCFKVDEP